MKSGLFWSGNPAGSKAHFTGSDPSVHCVALLTTPYGHAITLKKIELERNYTTYTPPSTHFHLGHIIPITYTPFLGLLPTKAHFLSQEREVWFMAGEAEHYLLTEDRIHPCKVTNEDSWVTHDDEQRV